MSQIKRLIFKYELMFRDFVEKEKFHEAKVCKGIIEDLNKIKE